jgi:xanthine dehydrogenase accessory factor
MFEIADRLLGVVDRGRPVVVATAISIAGSAPRTVGTSMAFDGEAVIGSIAGGCVEGAVLEQCELTLVDGQARVVEYGVNDETAFSVGLTCGGQLRVHLQLVDDHVVEQLRQAVAGQPAGLATVIDGSIPTKHEGRIRAELDARIALGETALMSIDCGGDMLEVFFETAGVPPRMIILGAMEFSAALSAAAQVLGFRVVVCDPRPMFATAVRFPGATTVVDWPPSFLESADLDPRTVVCVLSHDARFDAEAISIALASPARYVGAMGSRVTHDRRMASLRERGVPESDLARLHSPIGLDLGASTPEETAVSILAEILAARTGATAAPLTATRGAIHLRPTVTV